MRRQRPQSEDVVVLMTGDRGVLALAKSLLDSAAITYAVTSDCVEDFFGWGRLGAAYNFVTGPAKIFVHRNDEQAAREVIGEISSFTPARPLWLRVIASAALLMSASLLVRSAVGLVRDFVRYLRPH